MSIRFGLLAALSVFSHPSEATEYVKEVTLTWVSAQATRPIQPSTQNHDLISFALGTGWSVSGGSGGSACSETSAVLPADNPTVRAIALAAIASGATVHVAVDNTLPMLGSYCQISMLSIKAN